MRVYNTVVVQMRLHTAVEEVEEERGWWGGGWRRWKRVKRDEVKRRKRLIRSKEAIGPRIIRVEFAGFYR